MSEDRAVVSKQGISDTPILRFSLARKTATVGLLVGSVMTLVIVGVSWLAVQHHISPIWGLWVADGFAAALAILAAMLIILASTNWGIALHDDGVIVFERVIAPGKVLQRRLDWTDLHHPELERDGNVLLMSDGLPLDLSAGQARAILTDPRYPRRGEIPREVAKALRIPDDIA